MKYIIALMMCSAIMWIGNNQALASSSDSSDSNEVHVSKQTSNVVCFSYEDESDCVEATAEEIEELLKGLEKLGADNIFVFNRCDHILLPCEPYPCRQFPCRLDIV
ncbi:MAG: hypothetical protein OXC44_07990 [Proteobacteria bacterium]|nr:hypothetical protein [Pseudomonadota bacterium]